MWPWSVSIAKSALDALSAPAKSALDASVQSDPSRLSTQFVRFDEVSEDERSVAELLEAMHDLLHRGDREILAFACVRGFVLVTCDNGLTAVAREMGVKCINPCMNGRGPAEARRAGAVGLSTPPGQSAPVP